MVQNLVIALQVGIQKIRIELFHLRLLIVVGHCLAYHSPEILIAHISE